MRSVYNYKDLLMMITGDRLLTYPGLCKRGEMSFLGDTLVEGEENAVMCNGKDYTEVCNLKRPYYMMCFYFVTHSYSSYVETIIADLYQRPADIIISGTLQHMTRKQWSSTD